MRMAHRILLGLGLVALSVLPAGAWAARPAGQAIVLREHFVAGQTLADHMSVVARIGVTSASVPAPITSTTTLAGVVRYHVGAVSAAGGATATATIPALPVHQVTQGKTVTTTVPARTATVTLGPLGQIRSRNPGSLAFGTQAGAVLPAGPVAPGARWITHTTLSFGSVPGLTLPPLRLTEHSTFTRYVSLDGQRAAEITLRSPVNYSADYTAQGQRVHLHITGAYSGRTLFGITARQILLSTAHADLRLFVQARGATGVQRLRLHEVVDATIQLLPATR